MKQFVTVIILSVLIGCTPEASNDDLSEHNEFLEAVQDTTKVPTPPNQKPFDEASIEVLQEYPGDLYGGCYYSENKEAFAERKYLLVETSDSLAYMRIDGKNTEFKLIENSEIEGGEWHYLYVVDNYQLGIITKTLNKTDKTVHQELEVELMEANVLVKSMTIVGECSR